MHRAALNPALIRALLIVLFLVISQIMRARKMSKSGKPGTRSGAGTGVQLGDALREALRQRTEQARGQSELPLQGERIQKSPRQLGEPFQQPPKIEPESSFVPSFLLLALLACLGLLAYRYWAR